MRDGKPEITLKGKKIKTKRDKIINAHVLLHHKGKIAEAISRVNPIKTGISYNSSSCTVEFGNGPIADKLKTLEIGRLIRYDYMPDRTKEPPINKVREINYIKPETFTEKTDDYEFAGLYSGRNPIVKVEFILPAYKFLADNILVPAMLSKLFGRTTQKHSTQAIAELIDFYGISYRVAITDEYTTVSFYSLSKFADSMLDLVFEMFDYTVIDLSEFEMELQRSMYAYQVNLEKTDYIASREFYKALFKNYKVLEHSDFENISPADCEEFYKKYFSVNGAIVVLSGDYNDNHIKKIKSFLKSYKNKEKIQLERQPSPIPNQSYKCVEKNGDCLVNVKTEITKGFKR
jgi:hypothetical protein